MRLQLGRGSLGRDEFAFIGNSAKRVFLERTIAYKLFAAVRKMNAHVQRGGELKDEAFYSYDVPSLDSSVVLGVDIIIDGGQPFIGLDTARVTVSSGDLDYVNAACLALQYLTPAGNTGIAQRLAGFGQQRRPGQPPPTPSDYAGPSYAERFLSDGKPWWC